MAEILNAIAWPIAAVSCTGLLTRLFYKMARIAH
jgi:hypothetical protein